VTGPDTFVHEGPNEFVGGYDYSREEFASGLERFGVGPVLEAIVRAVESGHPDRASMALAFLRDAILSARQREFAVAYRRSALLELLRSKLRAPEFAIRGDVIFTLGKLGPRENARHLRDAFPWYMEHDPFRLDRLLFELRWLLGSRRYKSRRYLTQAALSPRYLTRWTTVQVLWDRELQRGRLEWGARRSPGWAVQLMRRLAQDGHPSVRADARRALAERRQLRFHGRPPAVERDSGGLADTRSFGDLKIERLEQLVSDYLSSSGQADYDIALVEAVARHVGAEPITAGYDPASYWEPLTREREAAGSRRTH
jgi:hypothetical protein